MEDDNNTASKLTKEEIIDKYKILRDLQTEKDQLNSLVNSCQKEIRRLKDLCDKYEEEHNTVFKEWQEAIQVLHKININGVEEENTTVGDLLREKEDYKSRCEKAIEYIQNHQLVFRLSSKKVISQWFDMFYKDTLNILNGRSDE